MSIFKQIEVAFRNLKDAYFREIYSPDDPAIKGFSIEGFYKKADMYIPIHITYVENEGHIKRWLKGGKYKIYFDFQEIMDDHFENAKCIIDHLYYEIYGKNINCSDDEYNYIINKAFNLCLCKENVINVIKEVFN